MSRPILEESRIHLAIREKIATHHIDIVKEVETAIAAQGLAQFDLAVKENLARLRRLTEISR